MNTRKLWCFFLILSIAKVCQGQLMCYVCDDCAKVTTETPQFECNEDFFNNGGATDSSIQTTTTTELSKTTDENVSTPTTTETTTTTSKESSSTMEMSTEITTDDMVNETTTMESNNEMTTTEIVTETTVMGTTKTAKPRTTKARPVPRNPGSMIPIDDVEKLNNRTEANEEEVDEDEVDDFDVEKATIKTYKPSAEFRIRQLRSVSDFTYHCFKIHATNVNGTMVINRGCSRIQTMESVCSKWEAQHPNEHINKCYPCTKSKCNGSSTLSVSITALLMTVIAAFMHRK